MPLQKNPTVLELLVDWLRLFRQRRFAGLPGSDGDHTPPLWFLLDNWSRWTDLREWRLPQASPANCGCARPIGYRAAFDTEKWRRAPQALGLRRCTPQNRAVLVARTS